MHASFLVALVVSSALGPMSIHLLLPALPALQADFGVESSLAQLTLSLAMVAMGISMLVYGPLSDRFGRRPVLLLGHALFVAGSLVCWFAPTLPVLLLGRLVQASGAVSGAVLARAMVRDAWPADRVSSVLAAVTGAMALAPMLAPSVGGFVADLFGWRAIFGAGLAVGVGSALLVCFAVPETRSGTPTPGILRGFAAVWRAPAFRRFGFQGAFGAGAFFAFVSAMPYVMVEGMGRPARDYGLYFTTLSFSFILGSVLASRVSTRLGVERMVGYGLTGVVLAGVAMGAAACADAMHPLAFFLPGALLTFSQGIAIPNSQAGAIGAVPERAGAASGMSGFLNQTTSAFFAQSVGMFHGASALPMAALCLLGGVLASASFLGLGRARASVASGCQ
jgi:DHA1 family bicyclomycin/chloramphenicol resistance-like MFS transporter